MDASDHVMRVGTWKVFSLHHVCVFRGSVKATSDVCLYIVCFTGNFILSSYTSNWYTSLLIFFLFKEFDRYHRAMPNLNRINFKPANKRIVISVQFIN